MSEELIKKIDNLVEKEVVEEAISKPRVTDIIEVLPVKQIKKRISWYGR